MGVVDVYFSLEECERVLAKLNFRLVDIKHGYRYYIGVDGRPFVIKNSRKIPSFYIEHHVCKRLGLELRTFTMLATESF